MSNTHIQKNNQKKIKQGNIKNSQEKQAIWAENTRVIKYKIIFLTIVVG